jgi:hypothetical protein
VIVVEQLGALLAPVAGPDDRTQASVPERDHETPETSGNSQPSPTPILKKCYCASHSRFFWGLRLHLLCTPAGLPIA